ncbi:hypothetical protein M011DRAFT_40981 [Sporormia fimetaria CBS 119925]|uniref:ABC transmembrane type-1 domain-containing protein n=1 Tax=Sporormia fimetaria CBS 119925 TaxID=1340428 RepID=A0A6A6VDK1_9PLEO|nr:hypothetical protein M011DRAFT_40981 [Sporormia fimetaria CBS 119925]
MQLKKAKEWSTWRRSKKLDLTFLTTFHRRRKSRTKMRVFKYATKLDVFLISVSCFTSIAAGTAIPLMNIVFGELVNDFAGYFMPDTTVTKQQFQSSVNQNA